MNATTPTWEIRITEMDLFTGLDLMVMGKLGGFADHMVVPETGVVPIRKDMPLESASLIACVSRAAAR